MSESVSQTAPTNAAEVCRQFKLSAEAKALLTADATPGVFFGKLVDQKLYADAIRFTAYLLPKREALWWGALCLWDVYRDAPADEPTRKALQSVVDWVLEPSEDRRRAAEAAGRTLKARHPAGMLALGVFWSGGSLSKPALPDALSDEPLTSKAVAGAILGAVKKAGRQDGGKRLREFLQLAVDIGSGKYRWDKP